MKSGYSNLGSTQRLMNVLGAKSAGKEEITLTKEEIEEIRDHLEKFNLLMTNMFHYRNTLINDDYTGLVDVLDSLKNYHRKL